MPQPPGRSPGPTVCGDAASELDPGDGLGVERDDRRNAEEAGEYRLPLELEVDDHEMPAGRPHGAAICGCAPGGRAAPPRAWVAGLLVDLIDEDVDGVG